MREFPKPDNGIAKALEEETSHIDKPAAEIGGLKVQEDVPKPNYITLKMEENRNLDEVICLRKISVNIMGLPESN